MNRGRVVILGASGNALEILDIIDAVGMPLEAAGVLDDGREKGTEFGGMPILGQLVDALLRWRMSSSSTASPANAPIAGSSRSSPALALTPRASSR